MKVEIWSDVMCPFCYIGKRRFEKGLAGFAEAGQVEVVWKSFQLNPDMRTDPDKNINQYLSEVKGWSAEQARQMNERVTAMAAEEGLHYNFDKAIVANSFDAHRLIQYARQQGLDGQMEERLFSAYFIEGLNTADHKTLTRLGVEAGLDEAGVVEVLSGDMYGMDVQQDIYEARQIGVNGVPYFVFNDRYAVSGAQAAETFQGALEKSWSEFAAQKQKPAELGSAPDASCSIDGDC